MARTPLARLVAALALSAAVTFTALGGGAAPAWASSGFDDPPPPPVTVNEFLPEDRDLSDCLSALPRPGCGSEARGGWRQWAVFGAIVAGLGVIGWRISAGVRRNRAADDSSDVSDAPPADRPRTPPSR